MLLQTILNKIYKHWQLGAVLCLAFLAFLPSINCEFTNWDDGWMLIDNHIIRSLSFSNLKTIFFGPLYMFNYQPFVFFTYAIEYHFFGLNAKVFHFTNVVLHLLNIYLVFNFIKLISNNGKAALIAALLFAVHPMRVESVTWITTRRDVLYGFFYVLSLIHYAKYAFLASDNQLKLHGVSKYKKHYVLALLFFVLSCTSKGMAVSLSLVLPFIDFIIMRKFSLKAISDKIPFFVISLLFGFLAVYAVHSKMEHGSTEVYPLLERMQLAAYAMSFYLYKLFLPVNLSVYYPYPMFSPGHLPLYYWMFLLLASALAAAVIYSLRFTRKIFFGLGFFISTIIMVLQLVPVGEVITADRYSYIPFIGLFYLVGEGYCRIINNKTTVVLNGFFILIILWMSYLTYSRAKVWKNSLTLWTDVIEKNPNIALAFNNRGLAKKDQGNRIGALDDYNAAIHADSNYGYAYNNRGNIKIETGDYSAAIKDFTKALLLNPYNYSAYNNRGRARNCIKDYQGAIADFSKACKLNPKDPAPFVNRGLANEALKDHAGALKDFSTALKINPDFYPAYYNRGKVYYVQEHYQKALVDFDAAIEIKAVNHNVFVMRGDTKMKLRDFKGAVDDYKTAINYDNGLSQVYSNMGMANAYLGNYQTALVDLSRALQIDPENKIIHFNLALVNEKLKNFEIAVQHYTHAVKLDSLYIAAYYNRGNVFLQQNRYVAAIEDFTKVIKLDTLNLNALNNRGVAWLKTGNKKNACMDWTKAGAVKNIEKHCRNFENS